MSATWLVNCGQLRSISAFSVHISLQPACIPGVLGAQDRARVGNKGLVLHILEFCVLMANVFDC